MSAAPAGGRIALLAQHKLLSHSFGAYFITSFSERWDGFAAALTEAGLPVDHRLCILDPDSDNYGDTEWLLERLSAMPALPEAFVCANDYLAIHLMTALKKRGLRIPEDMMISGFDGSPELPPFVNGLSRVIRVT